MPRTYIKDLNQNVGQSVLIKGWVSVRRDQGKMVFFDFRDMTGTVQGVVLPKSEAIDIAKETRAEYVVAIEGTVNKRPDKNIQADVQNGDIEMQIESIKVLSAPQALPFELSAELNLDTHLDYLPYTLRSKRSRDIFLMQSSILNAYRNSLKSQ